MSTPVALPLWLILLLALLSAWAVVDRLLVPIVRWFFRSRGNRLLERINTRLNIRIQPFKLTKREVLIDRLLFDPQVLEAAETHARDSRLPREAVMKQVEVYAHEIVPAFNAYFYFRVGYALARWLARALYRVRLGSSDEAALRAVPQTATVVFVMNHRSNMDYILVGYLAAEKTALSYAVGEWARVWPLQTLFRSMGAYFIRRRSRDALYRKVLERYVHMATSSGVTQAFFPEGRLSRDGKLGPPKLGILDYMVRSFDPTGERDIVFIPTGINLDRTLEDRTLLLDLKEEPPQTSTAAAVATTARFALHNALLMVKSAWHRFGYACVAFGAPVSLKAWLKERALDPRALGKEERFAKMEELANDLMAAIASVVPVLPVSLVAAILTEEPKRSWSALELKADALSRLRQLEAAGAQVYVPRKDQDYAISFGLQALAQRHLVEERDGLFTPREDELPLLRYYANSIAHLFHSPVAAAEAGA